MDTESKVNLFIMQFKSYALEAKIDMFQINRKTTLFLRELGWTTGQMLKYVIDNISIDNYYRGPSPHHNLDNVSVTEFGFLLSSREIYVKISINTEIGACLSFHPCEKEMSYPFRRRGESNVS